MADAEKTYLAWLNDAHAMELGLVTVLEKQAKETEGTSMHTKIQEHLGQTKRHAELVEECIIRNGGKVSATKDLLSKFTAATQGIGMSMMSDKMVKNVHSSYAAEHFEIATYTLLAAAADEMEDEKTASTCEKILKEEMDMANWLLEQLPTVVEKQLEEIESK